MQYNKDKSLSGHLKWIFTIGIVLLASLFAAGQDAENELRYLAKGTGRTTGHIVTLSIYNPGSRAIAIEIGNCFIPSVKRSQGYIIPGAKPLLIPPLRSIDVSLEGYCVNMDRHPVFFGDDIPPIEKWVSWNDGLPLPAEGTVLPQAFKRVTYDSDDVFLLTWPNSNTPFDYSLDVNLYPREAVRLLLYYAESARSAVDMLTEQGRINPDKEMHESIVQQVLWMYVSKLEGKNYGHDVFMKKYLQEWQQTVNQLTEEVPEAVSAQAVDIWETISLVGAEAKIIKVDISVSENLFREIPEGPEVPMRTTIIEMLNKSDFRSAKTGDILIPALYHMQEKKDDTGWTSLYNAILGEWKKWLDHRTDRIKPGVKGAMDELLGLKTMMNHDGKYFLTLTEQEKYNTSIHRKLAEEIASQIALLDTKDPEYIKKWRTMHSWLDAEWYQDCCSSARQLDALPDKFPSNLLPSAITDVELHGPGWKYTPPPVIYAKSKFPWIIPATGIPVAGIGTWVLLRDKDGKDPTDTTLPVAVTDLITIPCNGQGSLNVLENDSGKGIMVISVNGPPELMFVHTGNGNILITASGFTGVFTVVYTIQDQNAKKANADIIVTVVDTENPLIQCPPDISIPYGTDPDPGITGRPVVSDNCTPVDQINVEYNDAISGEGCGAIITREWRVTDLAGNQSICQQQITYSDEEAPVIDCPPDISMPYGTDPDPGITGRPVVSDNCTPVDQINVEYNDAISGEGCGAIITREWRATDLAGNQSICQQQITYSDEEAPVIDCPPDISIPYGTDPDPGITGRPVVSDNCTPVDQINLEYNDAISGEGCGAIITREWRATDLAGNQSVCQQQVAYQDDESPVIECPTDISIPYGTDPDPGITGRPVVSDNCTPVDQINVEHNDVIAGEGCGAIITREWRATDLAGNQSICQQQVAYQDDEPPVITCPPDIEVDCSDYKNTGVTGVATAEDNCKADVALSFVDNPAELSGCSMTIIRTWTATDQAGNTSSCEQVLMVADDNDPVFTFCPPAITVECGDHENLDITGRPEAEDACNDPGEASYSDETVHFDGCSGLIMRTFTIDDGCGNTAVCTQEITIADTLPPVISCPADLDVQCGQENDLNYTGIAIAEDNCQGEVTPEYSDDLSDFIACDGNIVRTFFATDQCGNTSSCTQLIFVENIPCSFVPLFNVVNDVCNRCYGHAEISVIPPEDFTYLWINGSTESGIYGLCSGLYTVTITNTAEACSDIYTVEIPNDEQLLLVVLEVNNPSSETSSDGSVTLLVQSSGALPPFLVFLNGVAIGMANSSTFQIINMPMGEYVIYIIDSGGEGCQSNDVFVFLFPGTAGLEYKALNMPLIPDMPLHYPVSIFSSQYEMPEQESYQLFLTDRMQLPYGLSALFPLGHNYYIRAKLHRVTGIAGLYSGSQLYETGDFNDEMIGAGLRQMIPTGNTFQLFHESLFGARQYSFNSSSFNLTDRNMLFEYSAGLHWPVNESTRLELSGRISINYFGDHTDYNFYGGLTITHDLTKLKNGKKAVEQISFLFSTPHLSN